MVRYLPSRRYVLAGLVALVLGVFSGWCGLRWAPALIPAILFLFSAGLLVWLALRPAIEVYEDRLVIGSRIVLWEDVRRLDRTRWTCPLIVQLTLFDDTRLLLIYPGDPVSAPSLLRLMQCSAGEALIDGIPYSKFWEEAESSAEGRRKLPSPRYRLMPPEEEAEVERLYQRLKTVGHIDPKNSTDEK